MAIIKVINESYSNIGDVANLINYIYDDRKALYIGGVAISIIDKIQSLNEFMIIKGVYHKTDGRQARHFIISFSPEEEEYITPEIAFSLGYQIAQYYGNRFQIIFTIHCDSTLHIHFVMNTVSYIDGIMYSECNKDIINLKNHLSMLIDNFTYLENNPRVG